MTEKTLQMLDEFILAVLHDPERRAKLLARLALPEAPADAGAGESEENPV